MHGPFSGTINDVKRTDIKICKKIKNGKSVDKLFYKKRRKMADDNHLSSVTLYNVTIISNKYYNEFFELGQQKILRIQFFLFHIQEINIDVIFAGCLIHPQIQGINGKGHFV